MIRAALVAVLLPAAASAQSTPPVAAPAPSTTTAAAPVEHRLTPEQIDAAEADGAERSRAAELLAMTRGEPSLALPAEKKKPQVHGEAGFGVGSNGYREVFASETTTLSDGTTVSVAGDYARLDAPSRYRPR